MRKMTRNYIILLFSMFAPAFSFNVYNFSSLFTSFISLLALAGLLFVAVSLQSEFNKNSTHHELRHIGYQKTVLYIVTIGGLIAAFRIFGQFQFRVQIDLPFVIIIFFCWFLIIAIIFLGLISALFGWGRTNKL